MQLYIYRVRCLGFPAKRINRFATKKILPKILHFLHFVCLRKIWNFAIKKVKILGGKMWKFCRENYGREMINNEIIKLLMLSSQSKEFHKFFCAINSCSYGFCAFFLFIKLFEFLIVFFAFFRLIHFREKMQNFAKKYVKYEWKFSHFFRKSFRSLVFVCWKS